MAETRPDDGTPMSIQTAVVLLAEDDPGDVVMITDAFAQSAASVQLRVVSDGEQAIDYVCRNGPAAPRPALILLDLNMPRRNGFEVLAVLKADAGFLSIPIVVLTTSSAAEDVDRCYALHANAYITKPGDYAGLAEAIRQLTASFLGLITLPPPDVNRTAPRRDQASRHRNGPGRSG